MSDFELPVVMIRCYCMCGSVPDGRSASDDWFDKGVESHLQGLLFVTP